MLKLLLLLLLLPAAASAQTCTPNVQQRAANVLALQAKLLAGFAPAMDTDVPLPLRPVLHDFKQALISTVDVALRCNNPEPAQLQTDLAALLHANKPVPPPTVYNPKVPDPTTGIYGAYLAVAVKPVSGQPDLFTVQMSYGIECGNDNILLVYRRTAQGYRRELVWQNPDLNSTGDAFGDVFLFTPANAPVPAFVIAYGAPWCTSNESMMRVDLVALATASSAQHRLDHVEHDYRRDADVRLSSRPDGVELHLSSDSVSGDLVFRPTVLRYDTTGGKLVQQPVAPNAQAFVDMWLMSEWPVIQGWGDPSSTARLKQRHDDLNDKGADSSSVSNFGPTLACGGNHYQVELQMQSDHATAQLQLIELPSKYAQVRANANSFTLLDMTDKPDSTCHGPDLMESAPKSTRKRTK